MEKILVTRSSLVMLMLICTGIAISAQSNQTSSRTESVSLDIILEKLQQSTADLTSYQSQVQWIERQPSLDDSSTLKTGKFYFHKDGQQSLLRLDFQTLKQDDQKEQKYVVQHVFDGVWLTVIDYQLLKVEKHQLAEEGQAEDVFEFVNQYFPILGFSKTDDLREQFEIGLVRNEQAKTSKSIQLHLKVKQDSVYRDDYVSIDFWIDKKLYLPARIVAVCTGSGSLEEDERDSLEIRFLKPKVNRRMSKKTFRITPPKRFGKPSVFPLR
jgi:outer membrane lipoprotein-sorting protein